MLIATGRLRTEGQKRGTKHLPGSGGVSKGKTSKKAGKRARKAKKK